MGSGTTAVAAIREGRNYIGIELMEHYCQLARKACQQEVVKTLRDINSISEIQHSSILGVNGNRANGAGGRQEKRLFETMQEDNERG
jgi:hypothetical protein